MLFIKFLQNLEEIVSDSVKDFTFFLFSCILGLLPEQTRKNRSVRTFVAWILFLLIPVLLCFTACKCALFPLLCFSILLFGFEMAFLLMRFCSRSVFQSLIFIVFFMLGVYSYLTIYPPRSGWDGLLSGCRALASFFPSRGDYDNLGGGNVNGGYPKQYILFQILVYVFFIYVALLIWGEQFYNRILNFCTTNKNKYVFWSKSLDSCVWILGKTIMDNNPEARTVISLSEKLNQDNKYFLFREMNYRGFILKLRKPGQIHNDCIRAENHFFMTDDFNWNILKAVKLLEEWCGKKLSSPIRLFIKINSSEETLHYEKWADSIHAYAALTNKNIEIQFINESELIARDFIQSYPMLKSPGIKIDPGSATVSGSFKILLLGFGDLGKQLLRCMVEDGQFIHKPAGEADFKVDIFDMDPNNLNFFFQKFPDANRYCKMDLNHIEKYQINIFSKDFYLFLMDNLSSYNRIVVCLENDRLNLNAAAMIEQIAKKKMLSIGQDKLFVALTKNTALVKDLEDFDVENEKPERSDSDCKNKKPEKLTAQEKLLMKNCLKYSEIDNRLNMTVIGSPDRIFTWDYITDEDIISRIGKIINLCYLFGKDEASLDAIMNSGRPLKWIGSKSRAISFYGLKSSEQTADQKDCIVSCFNRQSSQAAAKGIRNIALLLNPNLSTKAANNTAEIPEDIGNDILDILAEDEHLRWNAFHFMRGISTWELDSITNDDVAAVEKPKDIANHLRHAALVDFSELSKVDIKFGKAPDHLQKIDRDIIKIALKVRRCSKLLQPAAENR